MKRKLLIALSIVLSSGLTVGQTTNLGGPISWKGKFQKGENVPVYVMPGFDLESTLAEDEIRDAAKDAPWRFGHKYSTNISMENSGLWTVLPSGDKIWRVEIECPGASTVNVLMENLFIPEGAFMYLYDAEKTNKIGAFTSRNNTNSGLLGTELIHGERIVVEFFEPKSVKGQSRLTITDVVHGYRSLNTIQGQLEKALNSSGDCNIDVKCPLGVGWEDQIRSVAMVVVNGNGICTGALINNTCDDGTPYFLTANHCLSGANVGASLNWAFRFNWDSPVPSCATTANSTDPGPPYDQTAYGATVLVQGTAADHALLEIDNMTLNDAQTWNAFYAGWNNDDTENAVTQVTGIHHPSGDVKKICQADDGTGNGIIHSNQSGADVWYMDNWEQGVTEPGSSGSPLFDQNGRIIGQLYGGAAACSGTSNNGTYDYYGRLGVSWGLGISDYLAPISCGTSVTNDGYDPNSPTLPDDAGIGSIVSPSGDYCVDNFIPEIILRNFGTNNLTSVTINYDLDGGANNVYNWSGNLAPGATENVILPSMTTTAGAHVFNATTTLPNGNADSDTGNDAKLSNYNATIGGIDILIEINTDCWGSEVTWDIKDGAATVASGGPYSDQSPNGEYISTTMCIAEGCYDFTIYDSYGDGMYGTQWSCSVDGNYTITQVNNSAVLATLIAANADYGNSETQNFCVSNSGINELNTGDFSIYPNPSLGAVNVQLGNLTAEKHIVSVVDLSGREIYSNEETSNAFTINLNDASNGTYLVHITSNGVKLTKRIVLKN